MIKIFVKKIDSTTLPKKGTDVSAGFDVIATSDPKIVGIQSETIPNTWLRINYIEYETNLYIAPEFKDIHVLIHPRSSISKYNLVLANSIGLIDNDYRGMILCRFKYIYQPEDIIFGVNTTNSLSVCHGCVVPADKIYKKGDAIAQLVAETTLPIEFVWAEDLEKTVRGEGGFGSTDKKGDTLVNLFADDARKHADMNAQASQENILEKFKKISATTPVPYSEQIKQRDQK